MLLKTLVHESQFNSLKNMTNVFMWGFNLFQSPKNLSVNIFYYTTTLLTYSSNMLDIKDVGCKILSYYNHCNKKCREHVITIT